MINKNTLRELSNSSGLSKGVKELKYRTLNLVEGKILT